MAHIAGLYKLDKSENFDEYLKELGVGMIVRTAAKSATPTMEVSVNGDTYTIKTKSVLRNTEMTFKLGEEFEEERADGIKVKTIMTLEGDNKLVQVQKGEKEAKISREFAADKLTLTATVNGVTTVRVYKRL